MAKRAEYKEALSSIDRNTRLCLLYLEKTIDDRFKTALAAKTQKPQKPVDLSKIESMLDSLQKQIDGLKPKVDAAYDLAEDHDEQEKYLKSLTEKAEEMVEVARQHFMELYDSGYYREGMKRKIREEGLIK